MRTSETATNAATRFITKLGNGSFVKETLPNSFEDYTECYEQSDLESYSKFIKTFMYDEYVNSCEVVYHG